MGKGKGDSWERIITNDASCLDAIHFDLSPNLSPKRREALRLTPLPLQGRGWGLGLYFTQLRTAIMPNAPFPMPNTFMSHKEL
jgi:hypothetical protein